MVNDTQDDMIVFVGSGTHRNDDYPNPSHGGSSQIMAMARETVSRGNKVGIIKRGHSNDTTEQGNINFINIYIPLPDKGPLSIINKLVFSLAAALRLRAYDVDKIFLRDRFSALFPSMSASKTVYTLYGINYFRDYTKWISQKSIKYRVLGLISRAIENAVMTMVDKIVTLHDEAKKYLENEGYSKRKIKTIPLGKEQVSGRVKRDERSKYLMYAGRLDRNKRPSLILESLRDLKYNHNKIVDLKIAGHGCQRDKIISKAKQYNIGDQIQFLGWVDNKVLRSKYFPCAWAFVLPSKFDVFPNVILESMSAGTPVIASETMGARAIIKDGTTGFIFHSSEELTNVINRIFEDKELWRRISKRSRKVCQQRYNISKVTTKYLNI
ncbi:glycosyltransferase family 4 protein [Salinibacter ruber]|uniref:glycosyltransferase family 4 protein n=1 Tax=Salinibacter ruber TaxID=146919 RepID=UPI000E596BA9|nr:glycosyltransferase family 4 protein [Salinibacter ruber]